MIWTEPVATIAGFVFLVLFLSGFARLFWWEAKRAAQAESEQLSDALVQARRQSRHWETLARTYTRQACQSRATAERLLEMVESHHRSYPRPMVAQSNVHALRSQGQYTESAYPPRR